ncbi:MAG: IS3 family transposase [Fusobacteriaceae bacterium]
MKEVTSCKKYSIKMLLEILKVTKSSYYAWLKRGLSKLKQENENIKEEILKIHKEFNCIYGYRRMKMNLNRKLNCSYSDNRIYRLMRDELKIASVIRKKTNRIKKSSAEYTSENSLNRVFKSDFPKEKVLTDITEFKYGKDKKVYLCAMLDLFDRSSIAYKLSDRANTEFVLKTLKEAQGLNNEPIKLLHSDRGCQYTSGDFKNVLQEFKINHSMSRVGKCIDNGPMEGFFGILKSEKYYLKKYEHYENLEKDIENYITFYNEKRLQKKLGELTPKEFRENYYKMKNVDNC